METNLVKMLKEGKFAELFQRRLHLFGTCYNIKDDVICQRIQEGILQEVQGYALGVLLPNYLDSELVLWIDRPDVAEKWKTGHWALAAKLDEYLVSANQKVVGDDYLPVGLIKDVSGYICMVVDDKDSNTIEALIEDYPGQWDKFLTQYKLIRVQGAYQYSLDLIRLRKSSCLTPTLVLNMALMARYRMEGHLQMIGNELGMTNMQFCRFRLLGLSLFDAEEAFNPYALAKEVMLI